jgi:hypothetical protein
MAKTMRAFGQPCLVESANSLWSAADAGPPPQERLSEAAGVRAAPVAEGQGQTGAGVLWGRSCLNH